VIFESTVSASGAVDICLYPLKTPAMSVPLVTNVVICINAVAAVDITSMIDFVKPHCDVGLNIQVSRYSCNDAV